MYWHWYRTAKHPVSDGHASVIITQCVDYSGFFSFNLSTSICTFHSKKKNWFINCHNYSEWISRYRNSNKSLNVNFETFYPVHACSNIFGAHYFFVNQPLSCIYVKKIIKVLRPTAPFPFFWDRMKIDIENWYIIRL